MAGIRVSCLPQKCTEKEIGIHFNKPENGGGPVQAIYYPLFNNDAVVIFEEPLSTFGTLHTRYTTHVMQKRPLQ